MMIIYKETKYGFMYGSLEIERIFSDEEKGTVVIEIKTPKNNLQVYVTKTGKMRFFRNKDEYILVKL